MKVLVGVYVADDFDVTSRKTGFSICRFMLETEHAVQVIKLRRLDIAHLRVGLISMNLLLQIRRICISGKSFIRNC